MAKPENSLLFAVQVGYTGKNGNAKAVIGGQEMFYFAHCESPVGELMLAGDERHVSGLWMEGQKYFGATLP